MQIIISMQMLGRYYYNELPERQRRARLCSRSKTRRANNNGNKACSPDGVITFSFREISERKASVVGKKWKVLLDLKRNTNGMFLVSTESRFPICFDPKVSG